MTYTTYLPQIKKSKRTRNNFNMKPLLESKNFEKLSNKFLKKLIGEQVYVYKFQSTFYGSYHKEQTKDNNIENNLYIIYDISVNPFNQYVQSGVLLNLYGLLTNEKLNLFISEKELAEFLIKETIVVCYSDSRKYQIEFLI